MSIIYLHNETVQGTETDEDTKNINEVILIYIYIYNYIFIYIYISTLFKTVITETVQGTELLKEMKLFKAQNC